MKVNRSYTTKVMSVLSTRGLRSLILKHWCFGVFRSHPGNFRERWIFWFLVLELGSWTSNMFKMNIHCFWFIGKLSKWSTSLRWLVSSLVTKNSILWIFEILTSNKSMANFDSFASMWIHSSIMDFIWHNLSCWHPSEASPMSFATPYLLEFLVKSWNASKNQQVQLYLVFTNINYIMHEMRCRLAYVYTKSEANHTPKLIVC